jgi:hypothetical protein
MLAQRPLSDPQAVIPSGSTEWPFMADTVEKLMWDYFEVDVTQQCFGETGRLGRLLHRSQQLDSKVTDKNGQRSFSTE